MTGFLLTFFAVLLTGLGARDQLTVAALVRNQGERPALLIWAIVVSIMTAAFAVWAAVQIAPMLAQNARLIFVAIALLFASIELLISLPLRKIEESTRSLFAISIVLLAHQLTDAVRFLVFAIAVAVNAPFSVAMGACVGAILLHSFAWMQPHSVTWHTLRNVRRIIGAIMILLCVYLALMGFGQI